MLLWIKDHVLRWIVWAFMVEACVSYNSRMKFPDNREMNTISISDKILEKICRANQNVIANRLQLERKLVQEGKIINPRKKVTDISLIRRERTDEFTHLFEANQLQFQAITEDIIQRQNLSSQQVANVLPNVNIDGQYCSQIKEECLDALPNPRCDGNPKYRTADGTCNNLQNPRWGAAFTCFLRLQRAFYTGVSGFRQSVLGGPLPQPRVLSLNVHNNLERPTNYVTHMYMFFGQLLDHDITQAPISVTVDNQAIQCCPAEGQTHPQCAPIAIRPDDPFYSQFNTTCLNFVRSAICPTCNLGCRQQINQITAFIDASFVYGNSLNETANLRANDGTGRLRIARSPFGDLLPPSPEPLTDQCSFVNTSDICFQSGDARVNQHTTLASLHTVYMREHNRIADELSQINPQWDDERLFQEARRIVGAEMQVITYKEFLPITLGPDRMSYFELWISNRRFTIYNPWINPSIYNEFSGAAFRFGHSLINGVVTQNPRTSNGNQLRLLRNEFFQPFELRNGLIGPLLSGVSNSPAQWFDRHLVPDVTNYLYRIRGSNTGLDLASFNIQRGRDHGLPPYTEMVRFCSDNQVVLRNFNDLVSYDLMSRSNAQLLSQNYSHVNDIDLWTGIVSELPKPEAVVGPTAACIIGEQFRNLKYGDRFYFEHRYQPGSFTYQQMEELKKTTLSRLICANTEVNEIADNAMLFNSWNNPIRNCRYLQGIDLSYWRD